MKEEKELVWLPKKLAKQIEGLENPDNFVKEYIEESKREIKTNLDNLDDDIIQYKAAMITARQKFKEAKDGVLKANYEVWEKFEEDNKSLRKMTDVLLSQLRPIKNEVDEINQTLSKISTYQMKDLLELLQKIGYALQDNQTREVLKTLIDAKNNNK